MTVTASVCVHVMVGTLVPLCTYVCMCALCVRASTSSCAHCSLIYMCWVCKCEWGSELELCGCVIGSINKIWICGDFTHLFLGFYHRHRCCRRCHRRRRRRHYCRRFVIIYSPFPLSSFGVVWRRRRNDDVCLCARRKAREHTPSPITMTRWILE